MALGLSGRSYALTCGAPVFYAGPTVAPIEEISGQHPQPASAVGFAEKLGFCDYEAFGKDWDLFEIGLLQLGGLLPGGSPAGMLQLGGSVPVLNGIIGFGILADCVDSNGNGACQGGRPGGPIYAGMFDIQAIVAYLSPGSAAGRYGATRGFPGAACDLRPPTTRGHQTRQHPLAGRVRRPRDAPPPATVDYAPAAVNCLSQVMGNDTVGDCTCAGAGHALGIWTGNGGGLVTLTREQVLAMYSAITGYNPADPSTDQGADEVSGLNYLMSTGYPTGQKLAAYVLVDGTNKLEVQQAMWLAESLYFGVGLPDAWVNPFPSAGGFTWQDGDPDPSNGHCFVGTGYDDQGVQIDTWGLLGTITYDAIAHLTRPNAGGQLYALWSEDFIAKATGKTPAGFDWDQLQTDIDAMRAASRGGLFSWL